MRFWAIWDIPVRQMVPADGEHRTGLGGAGVLDQRHPAVMELAD